MASNKKLQQLKVRGPRASPYQINYLVDYMIQNREFACGQHSGNRETVKSVWQKLTDELNSIGKTEKSLEQWRTTWRDLKNHTSTKMKQVISGLQSQENNKDLSLSFSSSGFNEIDRKILLILGYGLNTESAWSPGIVSVSEESQEFEPPEPDAPECNINIIDFMDNSLDFETKSEPEAPKQIPTPDQKEASVSRESAKYHHYHNRRVQRKKRLKNRFLTIAEMQAKSMTVFASALDKMASAMQDIAKATDKFAEAALIRAKSEQVRIKVETSSSVENTGNKETC